MNKAYTQSASRVVEATIHADQARIAKAVGQLIPPKHLVAVVMIGGYARGEGGYWIEAGKVRAYNDYDYFVIFKDCSTAKRSAYQAELARLALELEAIVGVEVDFFPLVVEQISSLPRTLMNTEMRAGHKVILGDVNVLAKMPPYALSEVPLIEFKRLMLNRGVLLLMNQQALLKNIGEDRGRDRVQDRNQDWDKDQFLKYLNKAILACGDAFLHSVDRYHLSYLEKLKRIQALEMDGLTDLKVHYARAVNHKLHPQVPDIDKDQLIALNFEIVQLWHRHYQRLIRLIENQDSITMQSQVVTSGRNMLINLRDVFRKGDWKRARNWFEYPREQLYRSLPELLVQAVATLKSESSGLEPPKELGSELSYEQFMIQWRCYS